MSGLTTRTRRLPVAPAVLSTVLATVLIASCGALASFPVREADARGTLAPYTYDPTETYANGVMVFRLAVEEGEYPYFRDAGLFFDDNTVIGTQKGEDLGLEDLSAGLWVEVWTGACGESNPVQCGVTHVRLTRDD